MRKLSKIIAVIMVLSMLLLMTSVFVSADEVVTSFSDVPRSHWGYDTIMRMTKNGLFQGVKEVINGVGEFAPDKTMSRAEFITVCLRAMYPSEATKIVNQSGDWWRGYYNLALEKGLLFSNELENGAMNKSMTRQEMAMVMVRCVEKNGEIVSNLISLERIADYNTIPSFYKNYVRKCFSLGLICGIDGAGTFAPTMSLTRAQAATVLCRLVDKNERVDVNGSAATDADPNAEFPWENGGKQPSQYTWAEFEALTATQQMAFQNSFGSIEAFDAWMQEAQKGAQKNPWENGGKQPSQYTWAEFEALTAAQQMAFQNSFGSTKAFDAWMQAAQKGAQKNPWENGGKQPSQYTWAEFEALTAAQQMAFQNSFGSIEAFDAWMQKAQKGSQKNPWENGGKQPSQYTWAEFEALTATQQMAFQNSFGSIEAFDVWMQEAQKGLQKNPWENGGKQPSQYTWAEFEVLTPAQQMAFQNSFGSLDEFDKWLQRNEP